jgi:putative membrane protein
MANLGLYIGYMAMSIGLIVVAVAIYTVVTPYNEIRLIRAGNTAAAYSLGGMVIGFAAAVASASAHSVGIMDMVVWSAVALVGQLLAFLAAAAVLGGFKAAIEQDRLSYGIALGALSIAVGIVNAGALTY